MEKMHIGMVIRQEMKRKRVTVAQMAEQLGLQRPNFYRILRKEAIGTDTLYKISDILKVDLFALYSKQLQEEWEK